MFVSLLQINRIKWTCGAGTVKRGNTCISINNNPQGQPSQRPSNNQGGGFIEPSIGNNNNSLKLICKGANPLGAVLCGNSLLGTGALITKFLGQNCNSGRKCEYRCNSVYQYVANNGRPYCKYVGNKIDSNKVVTLEMNGAVICKDVDKVTKNQNILDFKCAHTVGAPGSSPAPSQPVTRVIKF